jgi:hypothetical protein
MVKKKPHKLLILHACYSLKITLNNLSCKKTLLSYLPLCMRYIGAWKECIFTVYDTKDQGNSPIYIAPNKNMPWDTLLTTAQPPLGGTQLPGSNPQLLSPGVNQLPGSNPQLLPRDTQLPSSNPQLLPRDTQLPDSYTTDRSINTFPYQTSPKYAGSTFATPVRFPGEKEGAATSNPLNSGSSRYPANASSSSSSSSSYSGYGNSDRNGYSPGGSNNYQATRNVNSYAPTSSYTPNTNYPHTSSYPASSSFSTQPTSSSYPIGSSSKSSTFPPASKNGSSSSKHTRLFLCKCSKHKINIFILWFQIFKLAFKATFLRPVGFSVQSCEARRQKNLTCTRPSFREI